MGEMAGIRWHLANHYAFLIIAGVGCRHRGRLARLWEIAVDGPVFDGCFSEFTNML